MPANTKHIPSLTVPAKPFLKWAGGKRQLLQQFNTLYPQDLRNGSINNYYEPFLGSGAVFFDIMQRFPVKKAFLFDVNADLVLTYTIIQQQVAALTDQLLTIEKKYLALQSQARLDYFYEQRSKFNRQSPAGGRKPAAAITRAAQLIFLNRTCYNGLFRVNSKGAFNTPVGDYKRPSICDPANLAAVSALLSKASIQQADFKQALKRVKPGSFVYLDPPYRPLSRTAYFTAYSHSQFADKEQQVLAGLFHRLDTKGALLMLSNSDTKDGFFDALYKGFSIKRVPAKRMINTNVTGRGLVNEIVITNYPVNRTN